MASPSDKGKRQSAKKRPAKATTTAGLRRKRSGRAVDKDPLSRIFEASPSGLLITRASDGKVVEINEAFCSLLGYTRTELLGRPLYGRGLLLDGIDRDFLLRTIRRDGAVHNLQRHFRHRSGEERVIVTSIHAIAFQGAPCLLSTAVDITSATHTAAALVQSEESFRALFRHLPVSVMHCKLNFEDDQPADYEVLRVNPAFYAMTGLTDVEGRRMKDVVGGPERQRQDWLAVFARIVRTGLPERFERYSPERDTWNSHTVYSPALGEFVVVSKDISQRKRADQEIVNAKAKLDAALNAMSDAVFISDANGGVLEFNDAFASFHRFRGREECSRALAEKTQFLDVYFTDGTLAPHDQWAVPRALRGETGSSVEFKLRRRDTGESWYGSYSFAPIRDATGGIVGSIVTGRDVTDQKRLAGELQKLSLVVEQSPESIMITAPDGRIEYVNEALVQKSGYRRDELIGRSPRLFGSGNTPAETVAGLREALIHGRVFKCEFFNRRKDGSEYVDSAVINPIRSADGTVTHFVAVADDVTERKRMDAELELHRHHLTAMVAERTTELALSKTAAEAATAAKTAFLATMSHEIRTPLNAVLGAAQLGYRDSTDERVRVAFRRILESGRLLLASVNDVLDLSKIEASKLSLESLPVAPAGALDEAISAMSPAATAKGLRLVSELAPNLPEAFLGDPVRVGQILLNLTSNAIKFTERGEVRLSARTAGDRIVLAVADTGIGIRAEDLQRMFEPFEQAEAHTSRRFGGTGLGLAISQRLARLMNGELTVTSSPGEGSTFVLSLPLVATHLVREVYTPSGLPCAGRLRGLRILAAEDNALNREVLEDALRGEGAEVVIAENGVRAVEAVAGREPNYFHLVLMDVQMPELDGLEATRRIHDVDRSLPVVGQTAHVHAEDHQACHESGMVEVVTKPLAYDELVTTIRRCARGATAHE